MMEINKDQRQSYADDGMLLELPLTGDSVEKYIDMLVFDLFIDALVKVAARCC